MALNIVWTKRASDKLHSIANFTEKEFGIIVTKQIIKRIFHLLEIIAEYPEIGSVEREKKLIRGITVTNHNKIFYRVDFNNNKIIILNIFDNRSNLKKY